MLTGVSRSHQSSHIKAKVLRLKTIQWNYNFYFEVSI